MANSLAAWVAWLLVALAASQPGEGL